MYTNGTYSDMHQAYAAGLAEGYLTKEILTLHWHNTMMGFCATPSAYCQKLKSYLLTNFAWIENKIEKNPNDKYWHQVGKFYIT